MNVFEYAREVYGVELLDHPEVKLNNLVFKNISNELWREYVFSDGFVIGFEGPALVCTDGTGHRIITQDGLSHYVPEGWRTFSFEVATGTVPFSF